MNISVTNSSALHQDQRLHRGINNIIKEKNRELTSYETIKKFTILPGDLTEEAGEITPTLKVKRRFVTEKYKDLLENLYK